MCGIAGIFAYGRAAAPVDEAELLRIRERMQKRGPDGAGLWLSPDRRTGLAHRRLAIIDLAETGAQPMSTPDGRLVITFNGEIYNYRDLRRELEGKGHVFRSQSDTEVLLHLYAERGPDMVDALRGMFAFGIWDTAERKLFLARDPFGIKPLYYADTGGTLRFASQVKALLAGGAIDTAPEPAGSAGFLLWGCVPEPYTLYREIHCLPAGATLSVRPGLVEAPRAYFSVRDTLIAAQQDVRPFVEDDRDALAAALRSSVRRHLVSDVPVGVLLSAGADSSLIAGLAAAEQRTNLHTMTLGFSEFRGGPDDEVPLAERVAAILGGRHQTRWIAREEFDAELAAILDAMDQPSTDGVNTFLVCRELARSGLKVALSGLGGDELFGGYPSFRDVPRAARWLAPARRLAPGGRLLRALASPLLSTFTSPKFAGLLEYGGSFEGAYLLRRALFMPWELNQSLDPVALHVGLERLNTLPAVAGAMRGINSAHARVAALEMSWYMRNQLLRDADWAGMAHSVELRVPLVDVDLFRTLAPWLTSATPPRKADALGATNSPLREEILGRPKTGFSVPMRDWIGERSAQAGRARGLRGWALSLLPAQPRQFRALALVGDAFGGEGGIAKFNRDLLTAISGMPECAEVVAVVRHAPEHAPDLPPRVRYAMRAKAGKLAFVRAALKEMRAGPVDLVVGGHINFTPLVWVIAALRRAHSMLVIHGIDAWSRHPSLPVRLGVQRIGMVVGVSRLTLRRFMDWSRIPSSRTRLLPNCVDFGSFQPGPKPAGLAASLGLAGRPVVMTLGRMAAGEQYKGFDEVIEALPALARAIPDIAYLACGDGDDRRRLEQKAASLGVGERVVFAGTIPESRKADYYRLADAYVMPSHGEGFGIVILEALASGLPVMGSLADGTREALQEGALGELVEPSRPDEVLQGILRTLKRGKGIPEGAKQFSGEAFRARAVAIAREALV